MTGGQDVTGLMDVPAADPVAGGRGRRRHRRLRRRRRPLRASRAVRRGRGGAGRATTSWPCRRSCARSPGVSVIDLRPAVRGRGPAAAQAGPAGGAAAPGGDQRGGVRRLRRLLAREQLPVGAAGRDRVRREARDPPVVLQPGLHVPRGRLPVVRHVIGPASGGSRPDRRRRRRPRRPAPGRRAAGPRRRPARRAVQHLLHRHRRHRRRHRQPDRSPAAAGWPATSCRASTRPACPRRRARSCRTCTSPRTAGDVTTATVADGDADLYLSGDILQAASATHLRKVARGPHVRGGRRRVRAHRGHAADATARSTRPALAAALTDAVGAERTLLLDSTGLAEAVFGNHLPANVVLLGAAFQPGALPLPLDALDRAIGEQGRAAAMNREAFAWGRWVAARPRARSRPRSAGAPVRPAPRPQAGIWDPSPRSVARARELVEAGRPARRRCASCSSAPGRAGARLPGRRPGRALARPGGPRGGRRRRRRRRARPRRSPRPGSSCSPTRTSTRWPASTCGSTPTSPSWPRRRLPGALPAPPAVPAPPGPRPQDRRRRSQRPGGVPRARRPAARPGHAARRVRLRPPPAGGARGRRRVRGPGDGGSRRPHPGHLRRRRRRSPPACEQIRGYEDIKSASIERWRASIAGG